MDTVILYDSLCNGEGDINTIQCWYFAILKHLKRPFEMKEWRIGRGACPKQNNGVDCGVYVCYLMDVLSQGMDPFFITTHAPTKHIKANTTQQFAAISVYRQYIAWSILENECL